MEASIENSPREVEPSLTELSESILCPILQTPMRDPVIAADGHSYERAAIEQWIAQRGARAVSPLTGARLAHLELASNITLKVIIKTYLSSLPLRHTKELSQKDLALAIQLREEELSNQLAKQHKKLEQLSSVEERLGPMAEQIERLKSENEALRKNNSNNKINSNNNSNNDNGPTVSSDTDPLIEKHLSDIHSLSQQLLVLNKSHAANMIKRLFTSHINRKTLKQTRLIQEEENVLHRMEILEQDYQKIQSELQQRLKASLQEAESRLKFNLAEIGKKIAEHSNEEGDDEALERLALERRRLRESHTNIKTQLEAAHVVEQKREEQKHIFAIQEQKNRLHQIRGSKASKQRELSRWADYTKNYTDVIEIQRQQLVDVSSNRSLQIDQLSSYSKQAEINASKLMIARREREARKAKERAERENAERLLAERQAMEREAARLASLTPNSRVKERSKNVLARITPEAMKELSNFTIRGQLEEVRACLRRNRDLVHAQYDLTDLSERTFPQITGFQYAVWCGDWELWDVFLEFMTEAEAYDQLITLLKERPDITQKYGAPLSFFDPLLTAYQRYIDFYDQRNCEQCEICWNKEVGGAQRNMPAWFIYVFSEEGYDKAWPKQQMTRGFTRNGAHVKTWFEHGGANNGTCGSTFAFARGTRAATALHLALGGRWGERWVARGYPEDDGENSATLKTERTKKLAVLTERLSQASKSVATVSSPFVVRK